MKYAVEVLKVGSDPRLDLAEKERKTKELVNNAIKEFEIYLFFIEDVIKEVVEKIV